MPFAEQLITTATQYLNTGFNADYFVPGFIHKICLIPRGTNITQAQAQAFYATAQAGIANNTDALRWYPIGNFTAIEDKSNEAVINTSPIGSFTFVRDGKLHVEFTLGGVGLQYINKLRRKFHLKQAAYDMLIFDKDANVVQGTKAAANSSGNVTRGYSLELITVHPYKFNTGSEETKFKISFVFRDIEEFGERASIIAVPESQPLIDLEGLKDLEFQTFPTPYQVLTSSVAKIRITTGGGATDLFDTYGTALAALSANFSFRDPSNNALSCTVTADTATKTMTFTFSGTPYSSLASGTIIDCYSPTVSQLSGGSIPGFANSAFQLTK